MNRIEDALLRQEILDELKCETSLDASHKGVAAANRVATLTGYVPSYPAIFFARDAVKRVTEVRAVADEVSVRLQTAYVRDDTSIANSNVHVLLYNLPTSEAGIQAEVNDGMVL